MHGIYSTSSTRSWSAPVEPTSRARLVSCVLCCVVLWYERNGRREENDGQPGFETECGKPDHREIDASIDVHMELGNAHPLQHEGRTLDTLGCTNGIIQSNPSTDTWSAPPASLTSASACCRSISSEASESDPWSSNSSDSSPDSSLPSSSSSSSLSSSSSPSSLEEAFEISASAMRYSLQLTARLDLMWPNATTLPWWRRRQHRQGLGGGPTKRQHLAQGRGAVHRACFIGNT